MRKNKGIRFRLKFQIIYTILTNGYLYGFVMGKIYKGPLKYACVPGLNCYSCPGAIGSCPLGALQNALAQRKLEVPFAVLGVFFLFGSIFGRFVCGWLCPFGLFQDLLHKIPWQGKRKKLPFHRVLKYGKYVMLFGLAIIGSAVLFGGFVKVPVFCKFICPSGTLMGAFPLMLADGNLRMQAGGLFGWKVVVLAAITFLSVIVYRPFCQYLCPLGVIYGWFNRFSLVQVRWEKEKCIGCKKCQNVCPVDLNPEEVSISTECIKCGKCATVCPTDCIHFLKNI